MLLTQRLRRTETNMAQTPEFKDFMPGMEFFQSLLKGTGMPSQFANWVAPTIDVREIEQKITDLKAVLSWLETNARMTQNMIQALEVQRMTLHALKSMNVDLQAFAKGMVAEPQPLAAAAREAEVNPTSTAQEQPQASAAAPLFDPMQWWNTMTQQFTDLASKAMHEGGAMQAGFAAPTGTSAVSAAASPIAKTPKSAVKPVVKTTAKKAARASSAEAKRARPPAGSSR
jgi:hypothetical protein